MNTTKQVSCIHCKGTHGVFNAQSAHYLCQAKFARGLPTPCLGYKCLACNGASVDLDHSALKALYGMLNPSGRTIDAATKSAACKSCNGTGFIS